VTSQNRHERTGDLSDSHFTAGFALLNGGPTVIARRIAAILLLLFATGNAASPTKTDSPVGRQVFNRCLTQADAAWRAGKRVDALRWYHSAKKVALAHNLTLSARDMSLVGLVTRHEAGLAGPQKGRKPGCETDGTSRQSAKPSARVSVNDRSRSLTGQGIPPTQPVAPSPIQSARRTIPEDPARTLKAAQPTPEPIPEPPSTNVEDGSQDTAPVKPPTPPAADSPPQPKEADVDEQPEPSPPEWPDPEPPVDTDLVPPVTPPRTTAPPAPPRPKREPTDSQAAQSQPSPVSEASGTEPIVVAHPVKLAVDRSAVPIQPDTVQPFASEQLLSPAPPSDTTNTGIPAEVSNSLSDQQLILLMFGPIVIALFLLGLLTQEMPGPARMLAWIKRSGQRSDSAIPPASERDDDEAGPDKLIVKIGTRRHNKVEYYTATIAVPGLEPTRIVKRRGGSPLFRSRAAAVSSARHLARRLGFAGIAEPAARQHAA